jgi:hypothetical protein
VIEQWCLGDDLHCIEQLNSGVDPHSG